MRSRAAAALGLNHRPVAGLFAMTITLTLGLGLLYLTHSFLGIPDWKGFRFGKDRALPEMIGYVFTAWAAGLALYLAVVQRQAVLASWSAVFAVLLADDYFMLHERMAKVIHVTFGIPQPWGQPLGEIGWFGAVGLALLAALAVGHRFAAPEWQAASRVLAVLLGLLVLCGVVIDALHMFVADVEPWNVLVTVLEDGGELLLLAVVLTFLYGLAFCDHRPTPETLTRRRTTARRRGIRRAAVTPSGTGPPRH
ncbi:hypothetical protein APR04_003723 [Promicromonospora umidemergens]|uniref:Uncharacterized protein n=1 Tax=Promicromonospora umidemergens TaxID=629679 RepID=A0ABP8XF94_9MICO|nr:hypothetical protein [Promicromonospora umidemergens]MCP2284800.1 hypothetical protein [Promicromonospora umidemergens]